MLMEEIEDLMFCTSGFQFSLPFPTEETLFAAAACMPSALGPCMGDPFEGAYRATSLNRTARAPCAPGGSSLERRTRTHTTIATMGHSPSLRTEHALGAVFCPLGPRGYHFKALFREFPAVLRPGTKTPNKSVKTDVRSYESWHFRLKITLGGLQNRFWAPKK